MTHVLELKPMNELVEMTRDRLNGGVIVGLHGPARCGKDASAAFFREAGYGHRYFAEPLKRVVQTIYALTDAQAFEPEFKDVVIDRLGVTPRYLQQKIGTEIFRDTADPYTWVRSMLLHVQSEMDKGVQNFVISDVRFENEAEIIRELGGVVVHVRRDDLASNSGETEVNLDRSHVSEAGIEFKAGDIELDNNGTLADLRHECESLIDCFIVDIDIREKAA